MMIGNEQMLRMFKERFKDVGQGQDVERKNTRTGTRTGKMRGLDQHVDRVGTRTRINHRNYVRLLIYAHSITIIPHIHCPKHYYPSHTLSQT